MEEKKQKKIKASPRPGKLAGYMIGLKNVPGKTSLPRQGPFLPSREEKKILKARKRRPFSVSIIRFLPETPEGRMQYAPTRAHPIYFFEENICQIPQPIFRF
ncbi:MAG: hypothetical protein ACFNUF_05805 [Tannerella sp.]